MESILNFAEPLDVSKLDLVLRYLYESTDEKQRTAAQSILTRFKEHPEAWTRVDEILEKSQSQPTKFFALQVLQPVIQYHWKALPRTQCDAIRTFVIDKVVKISSTEASLRSEKLYLQKLNETLVQIIKQDWPRNWSNFISEIVTASKSNESLCENNMVILKLLSEEIFDFSQGKMTAAKTADLKNQFSNEFASIYQLCELVLIQSQKPSLLAVSLDALLGFLSWIPIAYIFETNMIQLLIDRFLPVSSFRNSALRCLTEIASLKLESVYDDKFVKFLMLVMTRLVSIIPINADIPHDFNKGSNEERKFIQNLAIFFCGFLKEHLQACEKTEQCHEYLVEAHKYLAKISTVDDDEVFKICLEYWNVLASDLYYNDFSSSVMSNDTKVMLLTSRPRSLRLKLYEPVLTLVRGAIISKMAKPEEILLVEDENGQLQPEFTPDTEEIILYNSMRETLLYLTHIDSRDTVQILKDRLNEQVGSSKWTWAKLNTICWAIGSISGGQTENDEKIFLVYVIRELLNMVENTRGKDNKAVIASDIMYIVGQYPRFLQSHWKFLKTVINKLFEFMHETFCGVREMACDTFLKISKSCKRQFAIQQEGESQLFIVDILFALPKIIKDLEAPQVQIFYEALGFMIGAHDSDPQKQQLIEQLMGMPNHQWSNIIQQASQQLQFLGDIEVAKQIILILKLNVHVASSLGPAYKFQLGPIFLQLLHIYRAYSETISNIIASQGSKVTAHANVRAYRAVKREILRLLSTFVQNTDDTAVLLSNFIPLLFEAVLSDYKTNIPDARDPEVISLMTAIVDKVKGDIINHIPIIFSSVFECTINMIQSNFEDHPEHRVNLFNLLRVINQHCFMAFFTIPAEKFKLAIDSIVWAFKHTMRNIADTGLHILLELWRNIQSSEAATAFYKVYLLSLLQDIFIVLTDTLHKSGFAMQAAVLLQIFQTVQSGRVQIPLWDPNTAQFANNVQFLQSFVTNLIASAFKNLSQNQINHFVSGLFEYSSNLPQFRQHLRDFLVTMKEFGEDNAELFSEEQKEKDKQLQMKRELVPGLVKAENPPKI